MAALPAAAAHAAVDTAMAAAVAADVGVPSLRQTAAADGGVALRGGQHCSTTCTNKGTALIVHGHRELGKTHAWQQWQPSTKCAHKQAY